MSQRLVDRFRTNPSPGFKGLGSWFSLAILILALFIVLMARQHLANSAASCYSTVTTQPQPPSPTAPQTPDLEPNVRVIPPSPSPVGKQ
jgi:hypothetical protein